MKPKDHIKIPNSKIGVILINLGTPEATNYTSMWKYLREFLSDKRVIELPRIFWFPILYLIILIVRPKKSGKLYEKIWNKKKGISPLKEITAKVTEKLKQKIKTSKIQIDYAMNYGNPSISKIMTSQFNKGCTKILIVPMYPQYSATTTASVVDNVNRVLSNMRWQPTIRFCPPYFDDEIYIKALTSQIEKQIKKAKPDKILASFHGIPKKYFMKGDPYHCHCAKTVRLLNEKLKRMKTEVELSFQSRFGPQEWLRPYMNEKFKELIEKGHKNIMMIAPGFSVDCLETLEEIKMEGREEFKEMGGEKFEYMSCLNDSKESITMLEQIVKRELSGWI